MDDRPTVRRAGPVATRVKPLLQIAHRSEAPVPAGVAAAAFDRAFAQRRAGLWDGFVPDDEIDAGESYARAVEQFDSLARGLTDREWAAPVATYGTVHDLVAHLLAIEIYTGKQMGLFDADTIGPDHDHVIWATTARPFRTTDHVRCASRACHARNLDAVIVVRSLLDAGSRAGAPIDSALYS